jgi:selenocysteine lyase/cysteine desulfurase
MAQVDKWKKVRQQAMLPKGKIYLNTAACGIPVPSTIQAEKKWLKEYQQDPWQFMVEWMLQHRGQVRSDLANFLGVSQKELALGQNFSVPLRLLTPALPGKRFMVIEDDYPPLMMPLALHDKELIPFPLNANKSFDEKALLTALKKEKPDWFAFSHTQHLTGQVIDIETIVKECKKLGIRVLVDLTQTIGAATISFKHIDVAVASCYKWMMAGFGNGFCYVNDALQPKLQFSKQGANHLSHWSHEMHTDPLHLFLEPGHLDHAPFARLQQAVVDQKKLGPKSIEKQIAFLTTQFLKGLKKLKIEPVGGWDIKRHGIISIPYTAKRMADLKKRNIVCVKRGDGIRISPHIYNTPGEINILLKTLSGK